MVDGHLGRLQASDGSAGDWVGSGGAYSAGAVTSPAGITAAASDGSQGGDVDRFADMTKVGRACTCERGYLSAPRTLRHSQTACGSPARLRPNDIHAAATTANAIHSAVKKRSLIATSSPSIVAPHALIPVRSPLAAPHTGTSPGRVRVGIGKIPHV